MSARADEDSLQGFRRLWLRSEALEVAVLPELGARLQTLRLRGGPNVLLEPPEFPYLRPYAGAPFDAFDTSGWDECFPTVAACEHQGSRHSDHGELWSAPWAIEHHTATKLQLCATLKDRPWTFRRTLTLNGRTLRAEYEVLSHADESLDVTWSVHPLLSVSAGSRIELPGDVNRARVEWSLADRLGAHGAEIGWPTPERSAPPPAGAPAPAHAHHLARPDLLEGDSAHARDAEATSTRLDILRGPDAGVADKLFVGPVREGRCAFVDRDKGVRTEFRFDPRVTPYLGLWICQGGWPTHHGRARHFTVALEPCSAPMDSLAEAAAAGLAWKLAPHATKRWNLEVELSPTGSAT